MIDLFLNARRPRNGRKEGHHSSSEILLRWEVPFPWTECALIAAVSDNMLRLRFQPLISSRLMDFSERGVSSCYNRTCPPRQVDHSTIEGRESVFGAECILLTRADRGRARAITVHRALHAENLKELLAPDHRGLSEFTFRG
jgi:hypothetical protein